MLHFHSDYNTFTQDAYSIHSRCAIFIQDFDAFNKDALFIQDVHHSDMHAYSH